MSPEDDLIFDVLARLPAVAPDTEREVRVQARCRSAISKRVALRQRRRRSRAGLAFISAAAFLFAYLAVVFVQAVRLAGHYYADFSADIRIRS